MERELYGGGIDVVGGLTEVDVSVRVHERVVAPLASENLPRAMGDHLIRVHVRRWAGAALDHVDAEMIVMESFANFGGGLGDCVENLRAQEIHLVIRESGGFLHRGERRDEAGKFPELDAGYREVLHGAERLDNVKR